MLTTRILNLECYTPRWKSLQTPLPAPAGTADRSQWEVTMESQFLSGPLLYLLIAWGVATAVFLGLLFRRSLLSSHEDDQIFLDAAEEHMAQEQRELVAKINALPGPTRGRAFCAGFWPLLLPELCLRK